MATDTTFTERPTAQRPVSTRSPIGVDRAIKALGGWLARHSVGILRFNLGLVFTAFGVLKFIGMSPAESLAVRTLGALTLGIVAGDVALYLTAIVETVIGLTLVTAKFVKTGLVLLGAALVGIMSPLVLFFTEMFQGGGPTLEAQYIVKDIVFVAGGMVVAAVALGARLVKD